MYDASADALVDVAPIHFKNAAGDHLYVPDDSGKPIMDKPCRVFLYGPGSEQFAMVEQRQTTRALQRAQDNDNKITLASPEDRATEAAQDMADLTSHFENFGYQGGELTPSRFKAFYADKKMVHFHRQVTKALAQVGNWKPGTAGTSQTA